MTFLKFLGQGIAIVFLAALLSLLVPAFTDYSYEDVLGASCVILVGVWWVVRPFVGAIVGSRRDPDRLCRVITAPTYLASFAGWWYFLEFRPEGFPWLLCPIAITACIAWRTWRQESWLRSLRLEDRRIRVRSTGDYAAYDYARAMNPFFFRWANRVAAVSWVWYLAQTPLSQFEPGESSVMWVIFAFACALLLLPPYGAFFMCFAIPFNLLFLQQPVGLAWVAIQVVWFFISGIRTPTDRRTNIHAAAWKANSESEWPVMG